MGDNLYVAVINPVAALGLLDDYYVCKLVLSGVILVVWG